MKCVAGLGRWGGRVAPREGQRQPWLKVPSPEKRGPAHGMAGVTPRAALGIAGLAPAGPKDTAAPTRWYSTASWVSSSTRSTSSMDIT